MTAALTHDEKVAYVERARKDPEWWVRETLGDDPWPTQVQILESIRDNDETDVPACHSSGKSFIAARAALWFTLSFAGSKVITTAPTERQVKGILWSEMAQAHRDSRYPLGGEMLTLDYKIDKDWWATGFTAPDFDPNRFQGFHAPHILVIVDEAAGVSQPIMKQIASLVSGGHARILKIGNPVEPNTPFHKSCKSSETTTIPIDAFDTPNFTAFGLTEDDFQNGAWRDKVGDAEMPCPYLITPKWVAGRAEEWGIGSNDWRSRVRGLFPTVSEGAYFGKQMDQMRKDGRIGHVPHDPTIPVTTCWDLGAANTAIWFWQQVGMEVRAIDYYQGPGGLPDLAQMLQSKPYVYGEHLAPHDIEVKDFGTGKSRVETAGNLGIHFRTIPKLSSKAGQEQKDRIEASRNLLSRMWIDETKCEDGIDCLDNYKQRQNKSTGDFYDVPEDNYAAHGADAFGTGAVGFQRHQAVSRPTVDTRGYV